MIYTKSDNNAHYPGRGEGNGYGYGGHRLSYGRGVGTGYEANSDLYWGSWYDGLGNGSNKGSGEGISVGAVDSGVSDNLEEQFRDLIFFG